MNNMKNQNNINNTNTNINKKNKLNSNIMRKRFISQNNDIKLTQKQKLKTQTKNQNMMSISNITLYDATKADSKIVKGMNRIVNDLVSYKQTTNLSYVTMNSKLKDGTFTTASILPSNIPTRLFALIIEILIESGAISEFPSIDLASLVPIIMDQGRQNLCVANSIASVVNYNMKQMDFTINLASRKNNISRFNLQYKENLVFNGINPNDPPPKILKKMADANYDNLYSEGAIYSMAIVAMVYGIVDEKTWKYTPPIVNQFDNFINPFANNNPLLKQNYNIDDDRFYLDAVTVLSVNYITNSFNTLLKMKNPDWFMSQTFGNFFNELATIELTPLILDDLLFVLIRQLLFLLEIYANLSQKKLMLGSFNVPNEFYNIDASGLFVLPDTDTYVLTSDIIGGHTFVIVGVILGSDLLTYYENANITSELISTIDPDTFYIKFLNSWGTTFGDNGAWYTDIDTFLTTIIIDDPSVDINYLYDYSTPSTVNTLFTPVLFTLDSVFMKK